MTPYRFSSPSDRGRGSYAWSSRPTRACNGSSRGSAAQAGARHEDAAAAGATSPDCVVSGRRSFQRAHRRARGSHASDGAQVASTVVKSRRAAACRRKGGVGLSGAESDLRDPGRCPPERPSSRHPSRTDPGDRCHRVRRSKHGPATDQPLDARGGGPRSGVPWHHQEHLDPICGSFFKRRSTLDRTACATGCTWTTPTTRRSMPPPNRSVTCTGVLRSFTTVEFTSCAATRRPESRPWRGRLHPTSPFLGLSSGRMLTTFAMAHVR